MSLDITLTAVQPTIVFDINITHNLAEMAHSAGLYQVMWRPEEIGVSIAEQAIPYLIKGIGELTANPEKYKELNPKNGWGSFNSLLSVSSQYLKACLENPKAEISVSR